MDAPPYPFMYEPEPWTPELHQIAIAGEAERTELYREHLRRRELAANAHEATVEHNLLQRDGCHDEIPTTRRLYAPYWVTSGVRDLVRMSLAGFCLSSSALGAAHFVFGMHL